MRYLASCPQLRKDSATLIIGSGMRLHIKPMIDSDALQKRGSQFDWAVRSGVRLDRSRCRASRCGVGAAT